MIAETRARIEFDEVLLKATRHQIAASRRLLRQKFGFGIAGGSQGAAMPGLPDPMPASGQERFSGLVCPDCSGNIVVRRDNGHLAFQCRVGHEYSMTELIHAKEERLESSAWTVIFGFEELAALLRDLAGRDLDGDIGREACLARAALAEAQAVRLRAIVDSDRPLQFSEGRSEGP